jgi:chitinase
MSLPAKVSGGYWQNWGKPDILLKDVPTGYNVVLIAFAYGNGKNGGGVVLDLPGFQSQSSFISDIKTLHGQGRKVLLSIGGSNDLGIHLTTTTHVAEMVSSVSALVTTYGFDGIDWDLENTSNFNVTSMVSVSRQLKAKWSSFAITINSAPSAAIYKQVAQQLGADLDMICHQFYDYDAAEPTEWLSGVTSRVGELVNTYKIPPSKIGIGVKNVSTLGSSADTSKTTTIATTNLAWSTLSTKYPGLRGMFVWSINLDKSVNYAFANQVAPKIIGTVSPTPVEPTPTPIEPTPTPVEPTSTTSVPSPDGNVRLDGTSAAYTLSSINGYRSTNQLVVYTPSRYSITPTNQYGTEAVIKGGVVQSVVNRAALKKTTGTPIPSDGVVLSGHGNAATWMNNNVKVGKVIHLPKNVPMPW